MAKTKKSKTEHCVIRNGNLFCMHCGDKQVLPVPMRVEMMIAMTDAFTKIHKNCPPTWKEPEANQTESVNERAKWWIVNGETGMSSKVIWSVMCSGYSRDKSHPSDPDDFKRCYKLLIAIPEWRGQMELMKPLSPVWEHLVDNWDKLTEMFEENERTEWKRHKEIGMYEFMKSLGC